MTSTTTEHVQPHLFEPVIPGLEHLTLRSLAALWDAVVASPTLRVTAEAAALEVAGQGGNRGAGEAFEAAFAARLDLVTQRRVSDEAVSAVVAGAAPAFLPLTGVRWTYLDGSRAACDFLVELEFVGGGVLEVPVNLKRTQAGAETVGDGVALRTLLRVARGQRATSTGPLSVARDALRRFAGRERIKASDYYLLVVEGDRVAGTVTRIHAQGLLSSVDAVGRFATSRHPNREVALYRPAAGTLPDDMDVNWELACASSPAVSADAVRLGVLLLVAEQRGWARSTTRKWARVLDDLSDEELTDALRSSLSVAAHRAREARVRTV